MEILKSNWILTNIIRSMEAVHWSSMKIDVFCGSQVLQIKSGEFRNKPSLYITRGGNRWGWVKIGQVGLGWLQFNGQLVFKTDHVTPSAPGTGQPNPIHMTHIQLGSTNSTRSYHILLVDVGPKPNPFQVLWLYLNLVVHQEKPNILNHHTI